MIIESLLGRLDQLEFELHAAIDRLAQVESEVTSLRVQTTTGAKTVTESKPVAAPLSAKSSR